jgi:hypothetical protein
MDGLGEVQATEVSQEQVPGLETNVKALPTQRFHHPNYLLETQNPGTKINLVTLGSELTNNFLLRGISPTERS